MAKGGARARSGPAPDPTALRRERDAGEWTILPADGRALEEALWPLEGCLAREAQLWERLWNMPQSLMWERYAQHLEVALYVRRLVEAEETGSPVNLSTLVRQMADSLGLTTPGMRANRWRITRDDADTTVTVTTRPVGAQLATSARDRLKVVTGGGT